jgi:hypothetical protein
VVLLPLGVPWNVGSRSAAVGTCSGEPTSADILCIDGHGDPNTSEAEPVARLRRRARVDRRVLTFQPDAAGTRMRWSGQVLPKGAYRLLGPVITSMGIRQEQRIWSNLKKHLEAMGETLRRVGAASSRAMLVESLEFRRWWKVATTHMPSPTVMKPSTSANIPARQCQPPASAASSRSAGRGLSSAYRAQHPHQRTITGPMSLGTLLQIDPQWSRR